MASTSSSQPEATSVASAAQSDARHQLKKFEVRRQQAVSFVFLSSTPVFVLSVVSWYLLYRFLPSLENYGFTALEAASFCAVVSALYSLCLMTEAIAHERLYTTSINPLSENPYASERFQVNQRVLGQTVEQFLVYVPGLFGLAALACSCNVIVATALNWLLSRFVYWVAYHRDPLWRGIGLAGMAQSVVVLVIVSAIFAHKIGGYIAVAVLCLPFFATESFLMHIAKNAGKEELLQRKQANSKAA